VRRWTTQPKRFGLPNDDATVSAVFVAGYYSGINARRLTRQAVRSGIVAQPQAQLGAVTFTAAFNKNVEITTSSAGGAAGAQLFTATAAHEKTPGNLSHHGAGG